MSDSQPKKFTFFVYAPDYTDAEVLNRRMSVRQQHLANVKVLREQGIMSKHLCRTVLRHL